MPTEKSTNVRTKSIPRRILRSAATAMPGPVGRVANALFFRTPRPFRFSTDAAPWDEAEAFRVRAHGQWVHAWKWGEGPTVLVQHGWGGRTTQLSPIIGALVEAGYSVLAVDAPGHGESGGRRSSIVHFADAIEAVVAAKGPVVAAVAHSLGAAAVALATQRGLSLQGAVLVAPFARPGALYRKVMGYFGLSEAATRENQARAEADLGVQFAGLDLVDALVSPRTLVIHDHDDRVVSFATSQAFVDATPTARLSATEGLGHNRILADDGVIARIVAEVDAIPGLRKAPRRWTLTEADLLADLAYGR